MSWRERERERREKEEERRKKKSDGGDDDEKKPDFEKKEKKRSHSLFRLGVVHHLGPLQDASLRMQIRDLVDGRQRQLGRPVPRDQIAGPVSRHSNSVDPPVPSRLVARSALVLAVPPVGAVGRAEGGAAVSLDGVAVGVEPGLAR